MSTPHEVAREADKHSIAFLVARGLKTSVAEDVVAMNHVQSENLLALRNPEMDLPWTVGALPREYATEGEGSTLYEALMHHYRLLAEATDVSA